MKGNSIYGLVGYPVRHSLSPFMHNAAFRHMGISAYYTLFEVLPENLESFLLKDDTVKDIYGNSYPASEVCGFNITIPHKVKAKEILERALSNIDDSVESQTESYYVGFSGAVNTVKKEAQGFRYWNTDASGFLGSLREDLKFEPKGKTALVIGCGGAGRAVIAALSCKGIQASKIYVYDVSPMALNSLFTHFNNFPHLRNIVEFITASFLYKAIDESHLLVNATPLGMKPDDNPPFDLSLLSRNKILYVFDLIYNRTTPLLEKAKELGLPAVGGLGMLLRQGMISFKLWTGQDAPADVMQRALLEGGNNG